MLVLLVLAVPFVILGGGVAYLIVLIGNETRRGSK
jgi:hypothetical protein